MITRIKYLLYDSRRVVWPVSWVSPGFLPRPVDELLIRSARYYMIRQPWLIDPQRLTRHIDWDVGQALGSRLIVGGDWDRHVENWHVNRSIEQRCVEGRPWSETDEYTEFVAELRERRMPVQAAERVADEKYARLEKLLQDMAQDRYVSQRAQAQWLAGEVGILLDREGRPIMSTHGNHRVGFAKCLALAGLPVVVRAIHRDLFDSWARSDCGSFVKVLESGLASCLLREA